MRRGRGAETARWGIGQRGPRRVSPASRTGWKIARGIQSEVWPKHVHGVGGVDVEPALQGVLLHGGIQLPKVIDASIRLGRAAGFHEMGNRNRREHANNDNDDHDFHQREARLS